MKTPEEIKKGLKNHVYNRLCGDCAYKCFIAPKCAKELDSDALAYIQQLESQLAQAERERDAAVADLGTEKSCHTCAHGGIYRSSGCEGNCRICENISCPCESCNYKWRGVCPENTKEE